MFGKKPDPLEALSKRLDEESERTFEQAQQDARVPIDPAHPVYVTAYPMSGLYWCNVCGSVVPGNAQARHTAWHQS